MNPRRRHHPLPDRLLEEQVPRLRGLFEVCRQLGGEDLRVPRGISGQQALRGPEAGEETVADALAGERVGEGGSVAGEEHATAEGKAHGRQGPGTEDGDGIAIAGTGQVPPSRWKVAVEKDVEGGPGGRVREAA